MNKLTNLGCLLLLLLVAHGARAQSGSGWTCSETGWQYDMEVWATVAYKNGSPVADQTNYEVAAFVDGVCRGVGELVSAGSSNVFYLRVYSNTSSGENVTFQVYDKTEHSTISGITFEAVTFTNDATIGTPSAPLALKRNVDAPYVLGDVNGDGQITITDAVMTINATFGTYPDGFIPEAADLDGNNEITITDAVMIIAKTF